MSSKKGCKYEEEMELRRGPWTLEEDTLLIHYIACHGEGRWNLLARCSGLKRTGKSCRLRWLNYLKPDVKRGNLTPEEQILILELHSKWGNRWSRIAQHLPGRTDNEIKNYWRTRVQKQARQLKIDANSTLFRDAVRCFWMPRLIEKMGSSPQTSIQSMNPTVDPLCQPHPHPITSPVEKMLPTSSTLNDHYSGCYDLLQFDNCSPSISADAMAVAEWSRSTTTTATATTSSQLFTPADDHQKAIGNTTYDPFLNGDLTSLAYGLDGLDFHQERAVAPGAVGSSSASDCSMMENNCMDNNMADSLWSIWMNCGNPKSYMSGESRA